jgi:hypothetical protein
MPRSIPPFVASIRHVLFIGNAAGAAANAIPGGGSRFSYLRGSVTNAATIRSIRALSMSCLCASIPPQLVPLRTPDGNEHRTEDR